MNHSYRCGIVLIATLVLLAACSREPEPVDASRFVEPDRLFESLAKNVRARPEFETIVDIDHARLAAEAGSPMPPAHVLIWSDPGLEATILRHNPLAAVDLPLRVLAFEDQRTGKAAVIANSYNYLAGRYSLPGDPELEARYRRSIAMAVEGIPSTAIASFPSDEMPEAGLITLDSPFDFPTTERRIVDAINAQSDTMNFGRIDFAARSLDHGVNLDPLVMILFGAPGPGGRAMRSAPTLGLDAFCQKLLIWQGSDGIVHVTFNDLVALAERQQVSGKVPLRVINRRLQGTFEKALEQ